MTSQHLLKSDLYQDTVYKKNKGKEKDEEQITPLDG